MFDHLGRCVGRWWWVFLVVWPALAVGLRLAAPPLAEVLVEDQARFLPSSADSAKARRLLEEGFPEDRARSTAVLVVVDPGGLTPEDYEYVEGLTSWLTSAAAPEEVVGVLSATRDPYLRGKLDSQDGQATLVVVQFDTLFTTSPTQRAVERIGEHLEQAPGHLTVRITGEAALGRDYGFAVSESLARTTVVTVVLVLTILVLVYRSPIAPMVPLATVAVSLLVSKALLALVAQAGVDILPIAEIILVVVLFGAGTDYCLFLISRYREELFRLQQGRSAGAELDGRSYAEAGRRALGSVGKAIAASSATDMIGLALMWFADFRGFRTTGPAIAMGLGVTLLAALTFAPSLSILLGRAMYGRSVRQQQQALAGGGPSARAGLWEWVASVVCRRPGRVLLVVLLCVAPLVALGLTVEPSYDLFSELPRSSESVRGYELLGRYFGTGEAFPLTVVLRAPGDFWAPDGRQKLGALTERLQQFVLASEVRSAARPLGRPNDLGYLLAESRRLSALGERVGRFLGMESSASRELADETVELEAVAEGLTRAEIEALPILRKALGFYISRDGRVSRLDVLLREPGYSRAATDFVEVLKRRLPVMLREVGLAGTTAHFAGATAVINDIKQVTHRDFYRVAVLVLVGVGVILIPTLRELAAPLYLLATLVLNYLATMGVAMLVFVVGAGYAGLDWKVQFFMFVLLIAVGVDYNIFIMTRIKEEVAKRGQVEGVREAVVRTGGVISSCGLIMAGAFCSMMAGSLAVVVELGFAVAAGILLDTFVVRPIMVPAIVLLWERGVEKSAQAHADKPSG